MEGSGSDKPCNIYVKRGDYRPSGLSSLFRNLFAPARNLFQHVHTRHLLSNHRHMRYVPQCVQSSDTRHSYWCLREGFSITVVRKDELGHILKFIHRCVFVHSPFVPEWRYVSSVVHIATSTLSLYFLASMMGTSHIQRAPCQSHMSCKTTIF